MIKPGQLLPLVLSLAIAAAATLAQPATPGSEEPSSEEKNGGAADPDSSKDRDSTQAPSNTDDGQPTRKESPFEYRPSEEISEDLPVSFPVDI